MLSKLKSLGPGLLYAGAAIGVSHLVQSTKAGAHYGYILIIGIVLAHVLKYPFFAIGPRYTNLTGDTLVKGYKKVGKWALYLVAVLTFVTMFTVQAAVTVVTAGLTSKLTGVVLDPWIWSAILLAICFLILRVGNFKILDNLMKLIMVVLALSTVLAFIFSFQSGGKVSDLGASFSVFNFDDASFLIGFLGWMPAPLDIAIWHSIWTASHYKNAGKKSLKAENFDFNVGFFGTAILAICFLMLGANMLYGSGIAVETSGAKFAHQLVDLFTTSLGSWAYYIVLIAAFTTMFSTTLTCFDAMPRVMTEVMKEFKLATFLKNGVFWSAVLAVGAIVILAFFIENMGKMVMLATTISFITSPFLAFLSIKIVTKSKSSVQIWSMKEYNVAIVGFSFLVLFSIMYIIMQFS